MPILFTDNAIKAKARAIYGKLLKPNDYTELTRQRSVSNVASYLKNNTHYSEYLAEIDETHIHRGQLESLLHRARLYIYLSLCHYDFKKDKSFYHYVISDVETDIIIKAITLINSNSDEDIITDIPAFMQEHVCFDLMALSKIHNFDDLLNVLEGTPYQKVLKPYNNGNGKINLIDCELALKTYYYNNILNIINESYKGKVRDELRTIILMEVELINISICYRLKFYFNKQSDVIKTRIIPIRYKLKDDDFQKLLELSDENTFIEQAIKKDTTIKSEKQENDFRYIEDYTNFIKYNLNRRYIRFSVQTPVTFFALMTLVQIEIQNVTTIIEGVRYECTQDDIRKLLIL